jgi:Glutamyl-tRNAGlu reductase, dimerisation domain
MESVLDCATTEVSPVGLEPSHVFTKASSMHSTSQYPVNNETLRPDRNFVLDSESQVETTIASLKQHFEEVRQREVKRTRGRLGGLSCTQENAIESLSRGIIDQILNTPIAILRASCGNSHVLVAIATIHRIFNLARQKTD